LRTTLKFEEICGARQYFSDELKRLVSPASCYFGRRAKDDGLLNPV